MSEPLVTLDDVQLAFTQWRATRGRNRKIPDELWEQTLGLLEHYKKSKVLTTLGISGAQLKAKLNLSNNNGAEKSKQNTNNAFVHIDSSMISNLNLSSENINAIEINRRDGSCLKYRCLDVSLIKSIITQFLEV